MREEKLLLLLLIRLMMLWTMMLSETLTSTLSTSGYDSSTLLTSGYDSSCLCVAVKPACCCQWAIVKYLFIYAFPFPSNRRHRSSGDCLEGKRENYQVCSVQYCVQHLCTVQCTQTWTDVTVVCWLDVAFLLLYYVLQFTCVRFSFLGLPCVIVYLCICAFIVLNLVSSWDRLGRTFPKWPIFVLSGT